MAQDVLLTGAFGRVGTAIIDHLGDRTAYDFTCLDRSPPADSSPYAGYDAVVSDVTDEAGVRAAMEGRDAVIHLAGCPAPDGPWAEILENNVVGTYVVLDAAREADVERFVFASSNHVVGMYEVENAPEIYARDFDLTVDHTAPHRPDSYYGTSKCFGEDLGRYYVEDRDAPGRFYALRIGNVQPPESDHPYAEAERGVAAGRWDRGSDAYETAVARLKAMWQSRRDLAHLVDRCLGDATVAFDVFYGVSDNDRRWFDIDHAADVLGYDPQDDGEAWDGPPE